METRDEVLKEYVENNGGEIDDYLILTDGEADEAVRNNILDSLWAFRAEFISSHSGISASTIRKIQESCEDSNEDIKRLIKDLDHFIEDAIRSDGRGHFLSSYDGEENEVDNFFIYRIN